MTLLHLHPFITDSWALCPFASD